MEIYLNKLKIELELDEQSVFERDESKKKDFEKRKEQIKSTKILWINYIETVKTIIETKKAKNDDIKKIIDKILKEDKDV